MTDSLLSVQGVDVVYGSARAVSDLSFDVSAGSTTAVLGANGAGKSSIARALCGLVAPVRGSIRFEGRDITHESPDRIRRLGISYLPETRGVFPSLSVNENLRMAVRWVRDKKTRAAGIERAYELFPVLGRRRNQAAGTMSGGEQQMLSIGRGLSVWPKLLIADELSQGLAPLMVDVVFEALEAASKQDVTVILIEQFVSRALTFSDSAVLVQNGQLLWQGPASGVTDELLVAGYIGNTDEDVGTPTTASDDIRADVAGHRPSEQ